MRFASLLILVLALSLYASAQDTFKPGYIVKNSSDTVKGFIEEGDESKISGIVTFKKNLSETAAQSFTVADIKAFGFEGGNTFRKIAYTDPDNKPTENFAKSLLKGYYNLYDFLKQDRRFYIIKNQQDSSYLLYDDYFTSSGSYVQYGNYRNVLVFICGSGCEKLKDRATQASFNDGALIDFVKQVNACVAPSSQSEVLYIKPKMETRFFVYAGGMTFGKKHELTGRVNARFTLPSVDRKTSLNLGVNYMQHFEDKDIYIPYAGNYNGAKTNEKVTTNYVSINATFNYYLTNGKVRPYFDGGFGYSIRNQSGELNFERQPTTHNDKGLTYVAAIGVDVNITPSLFIKAEWRQETVAHLPTVGIAYFFN